MVDYILLEQHIKKSGMKRNYIAELLGMNRATLWQKLNGIEVNGVAREFTASELEKLKDALSLTNGQFRRIFFASERECKATKESENVTA